MKRTRTVMVILTLSLVLAGCGVFRKPNQAQTVDLSALKPVGIPTVEEKKAVFERVWGLFYENYPSFQLKFVNWEKEKEKYEPLALQAATWPQFFQIVNEMIFTLHDYHCWLVGTPQPQIYFPYLITAFVGNKLVVATAPKTPQLKPGMVILGLNGQSLTDCMQNSPLLRQDWFIPLRAQVPDLLVTFSPSPEKITVLDPHTGKIRDVSVPVYRTTKFLDMVNQFINILPYYQINSWVPALLPTLQVREMGAGIIYIGIHKMSPNLQNDLQPYMKQILKAKGIIIDVRNNDGGSNPPEAWFAEHFYEKDKVPFEYRVQVNHHLGPWFKELLVPLAPHISAPTAVLINGGDASSAELFTAEMEVAKSVRTFGSRTMGVCENTVMHKVMDGVSIWVPNAQFRVQLTGLPIDGVGIAPEVSVHESYPEFMQELQLIEHNQNPDSADAVLQAARKWVLSQIHD